MTYLKAGYRLWYVPFNNKDNKKINELLEKQYNVCALDNELITCVPHRPAIDCNRSIALDSLKGVIMSL